MLPADAGMILAWPKGRYTGIGAPRGCGDDPTTSDLYTTYV